MTEKALRLKKRPFASKILAAVYDISALSTRIAPHSNALIAPHSNARTTRFKAFLWKTVSSRDLGNSVRAPSVPPDAPSRFAERRTTPLATSRHELTSSSCIFPRDLRRRLSPDADRRRLPAPFLQAKFCDSLTDQSQSISVPLAQSRDHKQLSLSPYIARTNTRRHNQQCLAQSSRTSNLPP